MPPDSPRRRIAAVLAATGVLGLTAGGCESLKTGTHLAPHGPDLAAAAQAPAAPKRPGKHWLRVSQYVFHSDAKLEATDPLFRELEDLPEQIQTELALPPGETLVQVFLFDGQEKYEAYMQARYPRLPVRRAYFISEPRVGGGDDLLVFTWLGDNLRTDLRHELTHATLHGALKGVPLWLDEGLASFFELPPAADGVNAAHLEALRRGPFQPDLARLEKLGQVRQMEKPEYREAWAWTHLMLRGQPEARRVLLDYVRQMRATSTPGPLLPKLKDALSDPNLALADHLARVEAAPVTAHGRVGQ
jgi:hypothetical protein